MGFDISKAMRRVEPGISSALRSREIAANVMAQESVRRQLRQYQEIASKASGWEQKLRPIQEGAAASAMGAYVKAYKVPDAVRSYRVPFALSKITAPSVANPYAQLGFSGSISVLNRPQSAFAVPRSVFSLPRHDKMFGNLGLSGAITRALQAQGLASSYGVSWNLQRVQTVITTATRSILKARTTFGPIVVTPDYEDDAPFDYHPDLRWVIPDTTTATGDAIGAEELWEEVVSFARGIARHHGTEVLLSVISNGTRFLIRVSGHPAVAGAIGGGAGGAVGFAIGGPAGAVIGGASGPLITYVLMRR